MYTPSLNSSKTKANKPTAMIIAAGGLLFFIPEMVIGEQQIPVCATGIPVCVTGISVCVTGIPVCATGIPVSATGIPVCATGIPVSGTGIPVSEKGIPVCGTGIPVRGTGIPVSETVIPVRGTVIPVSATGIPVSATGIPVYATSKLVNKSGSRMAQMSILNRKRVIIVSFFKTGGTVRRDTIYNSISFENEIVKPKYNLPLPDV